MRACRISLRSVNLSARPSEGPASTATNCGLVICCPAAAVRVAAGRWRLTDTCRTGKHLDHFSCWRKRHFQTLEPTLHVALIHLHHTQASSNHPIGLSTMGEGCTTPRPSRSSRLNTWVQLVSAFSDMDCRLDLTRIFDSDSFSDSSTKSPTVISGSLSTPRIAGHVVSVIPGPVAVMIPSVSTATVVTWIPGGVVGRTIMDWAEICGSGIVVVFGGELSKA